MFIAQTPAGSDCIGTLPGFRIFFSAKGGFLFVFEKNKTNKLFAGLTRTPKPA